MVVARWIITCDRCGRDAQPAVSRADANEQARLDGWQLGAWDLNEADLCPACQVEIDLAARSS